MPLELQIIRANEFVRLGPQGHLNLQQSKKALELLAKACRKRGIAQALLDLRELPIPTKPLFTSSELASLVDIFREVGFTPKHKLAVLYRSDPHHGARMFAFISSLRGFRVRAFEQFEAAVHWLSEIQEEPEIGETIPLEIVESHIKTKLKVSKATGKRTWKPS
jgi:hypothetical protein